MTAIGILFLCCSAFTLWLFLRWYGRWNHPILVVPVLSCGMLIYGNQRKIESADPIEPAILRSIHNRAEQIIRGKEVETSQKSAVETRLVTR